MKYKLSFLFILISVVAKPCGWSPMEDGYYYYNLFYQTNISSEAYYPFLKDEMNVFYRTYDQEENPTASIHGNLILWNEILKKWSQTDIYNALTASSDDFNKLWAGKNSALELESKAYMAFARKCSDAFAYRQVYSWDYDEIRKEHDVDIQGLLDEGNNLYSKETNDQLRKRYGYQIIRILHYSQQYQEAVNFFEKNFQSTKEHDEIYYYALDQVAGCYYSLEDYEKAAYLFLKVFGNSHDRKESAFVSYRFCTDKGAEGKSLFNGTEDDATFILMKSLRSFSDGMESLKELYNIDPASDKVELLFVRELNTLERDLLPKEYGMSRGSGILPAGESGYTSDVDDLLDFIKKVQANPKIANKGFWKLSESYLYFLRGDLNEAKRNLSQIKTTEFKEQAESLKAVFEVFSWTAMDPQKEDYLAGILEDAVTRESAYWEDMHPSEWKYVIMDHVAHLYYMNGELAKAFLLHNRIENLERIGSFELIDDLLSFVDQSEKNRFEQILTRRLENARESYDSKDYLLFVKGHYYLQLGQPEKALPLLKASSLNNSTKMTEYTGLDGRVSAWIFSNNTKECFECSETYVMEDSVFLASVFSFIKPTFSRAEMAEYLLKLDSLTHDEKQWKRKLAHYLLGNYYFNVSNTGYFRNVLNGFSYNGRNYIYFAEHEMAVRMIDAKKGYNLFGIDNYESLYHELAQRAMVHYEQVIANSTDKELNARCLFMMAKCELNAFYNNTKFSPYSFYDGNVDEEYATSYSRLKDDYSDTKFFSKAVRECSYFRDYCSL